MLEIENLHKSFGSEKVLDGISLAIDPSKITLLLGNSGCGKTTLLRILAGLEEADSGQIKKDGNVGLVFQDKYLFPHLTSLENITLPLTLNKKETDQAEALLGRFKISDCRDKFPGMLSGGEKQRLAIARAMALSPPILCMDEPTSALDPESTNILIEILEELNSSGTTLLVSTHDVFLLNRMECMVALIKEGRIIKYGDRKDILQHLSSYKIE